MMLYDCRTVAERDWGIRAAVEGIARGDLVVLPTDTVYGIAADAFKPWAVSALLNAKGRGRHMPPPGAGRLAADPRRSGLLAAPGGARPGRGVLARCADDRCGAGADAAVGPRRHLRHRGRADAAASGGAGGAAAHRPARGLRGEPDRAAARDHGGGRPRSARVRGHHLPRGGTVLGPDPIEHRRLHGCGAARPARRCDPVREAGRGGPQHPAVHPRAAPAPGPA